MALWVARAGRHGERESYALANNVVTVGWEDVQDLTAIGERDNLLPLLLSEANPKRPTPLTQGLRPLVQPCLILARVVFAPLPKPYHSRCRPLVEPWGLHRQVRGPIQANQRGTRMRGRRR